MFYPIHLGERTQGSDQLKSAGRAGSDHRPGFEGRAWETFPKWDYQKPCQDELEVQEARAVAVQRRSRHPQACPQPELAAGPWLPLRGWWLSPQGLAESMGDLPQPSVLPARGPGPASGGDEAQHHAVHSTRDPPHRNGKQLPAPGPTGTWYCTQQFGCSHREEVSKALVSGKGEVLFAQLVFFFF